MNFDPGVNADLSFNQHRFLDQHGFGIQPSGPTPLGGDIHESFTVDPFGNISGGHTTIQIPGGPKVNLPWEVSLAPIWSGAAAPAPMTGLSMPVDHGLF